MRVLRDNDGQVFGTGYVGHRIDENLLENETKLIKTLRRLKVIPPRVKARLQLGADEPYIVYKNEIQLVLRNG